MNDDDENLFDKPTLDSISRNGPALERFANLLETKIVTTNSYHLVGLFAVAKIRLERLLFDASSFFAFSIGGSETKFETVQGVYWVPDVVTEGDVVTITCCVTYCSNRTVPLYIRQHWVDQLLTLKSFMENDRKRKLYVTGPQGCGKTCFLWMWANMLMNHGKRVLVIRYRPALAQHIWILEAGETKLMTTGYDLAKVVSKLLRAQTKQFDVCICIGVRTTELDTLRELMTELNVVVESAKQPDAKIAKLVYETTLDFRVVEGDEMTGKDSIVEKMWMESWQEVDYEKAVVSDLVKDPIIRETLLTDWTKMTSGDTEMKDVTVENTMAEADTEQSDDAEKLVKAIKLKYFYAGGCPRFMFDMGIDTLEDFFYKEFGSVNWLAFSFKESSNDAVNDLMQICSYESSSWRQRVPLSKYVLRCAYAYCRSALTNTIKSTAWDTQSTLLKGWAFELRQFDIIRSILEADMVQAAELRSAANTNKDGDMTIAMESSMLLLAETAFDGYRVMDEVMSGTVIWNSNQWNQGCFDAAFYFDAIVVTFQFATYPHSLKVQYLKPLRAALLKKGVGLPRMVHVVVGEQFGKEFLREATSPWQNTDTNSATGFSVEVVTSTNLSQILASRADHLFQQGGAICEIYLS